MDLVWIQPIRDHHAAERCVSLINGHNKIGRAAAALAHELGHYLIADDYTIDCA
jgi:Zn-dependent peptidase ImmA (M78 family)